MIQFEVAARRLPAEDYNPPTVSILGYRSKFLLRSSRRDHNRLYESVRPADALGNLMGRQHHPT